MKIKMKNVVSDVDFGAFILGCMKLSKEVENMCQIKCAECKQPLTEEEIWERKNEGLKLNDPDIVCDKCWQDWLNRRSGGSNEL